MLGARGGGPVAHRARAAALGLRRGLLLGLAFALAAAGAGASSVSGCGSSGSSAPSTSDRRSVTSLAQACQAGMRAIAPRVPRGLGVVLLAEDPVGDRSVLADRGGAVRRQRGERRVGARAHARLGQPEQLGELGVVAALAQQQLEDGALVGRKGGQAGSWLARG